MVVLVVVVMLVGLAWFVGRPMLYVVFDKNEPTAPPVAELIEVLPPDSQVVASREYTAKGNLGQGVRMTVVEPPKSSTSPADEVLAAYESGGWERLGERLVGSDEGCVSVASVSSYLSDPAEDETRKGWVREVVPNAERELVLTLSRC